MYIFCVYCVGFRVLRKRDRAVLLQSLLIYDSLLLHIHDRKFISVYQACKVMTKCDMHKNAICTKPCVTMFHGAVLFYQKILCRLKVCPKCIIKIKNRY